MAGMSPQTVTPLPTINLRPNFSPNRTMNLKALQPPRVPAPPKNILATAKGVQQKAEEEEIEELRHELRKGQNKEKITDELGDLLFACVNLARHAEINPETNGVLYNWTPAEGLNCTSCLSPTASSGLTTTYTLTTWTEYGCVNNKSVTVLFQGILFVPNAFTPNGDGDNDIFYAYGTNIVEFEMMIFDRWGEKLFTSDNLEDGWDGTYKTELVKTETYVWKINYKDVQHNSNKLIGTVTLIR